MVEGYYGADQGDEMKPNIFDPEDEKGIVDHMNNDHCIHRKIGIGYQESSLSLNFPLK